MTPRERRLGLTRSARLEQALAQSAAALRAVEERVKALEAALDWIVNTDPPLRAWDGWRFVTQIRNYARTALQTDDPRARALLDKP
jgi:hypothetical protein